MDLKSLSMIAQMGNVMFADNRKDRTSWKERFVFMASGIEKPHDWDLLSLEEKESRLNKALEQITKTK